MRGRAGHVKDRCDRSIGVIIATPGLWDPEGSNPGNAGRSPSSWIAAALSPSKDGRLLTPYGILAMTQLWGEIA
jgi:hypothetical protein